MKDTRLAIKKALDVAWKAHEHGFRKGNIPYIYHPLAVAKRLEDWGWDHPDLLQAAILHDVPEDTEVTLEEVRGMFGEHVAKIVEDVTFRERTEEESPQIYQEAKSLHLTEFKNVDKNILSLVLKVADRLCNVQDYAAKDMKYAKKYFLRAAGLFDAMELRKGEIIELGLSKWLAMYNDYEHVRSSVFVTTESIR